MSTNLLKMVLFFNSGDNMKQERYFIYDANFERFGNPKGYKKHASALGIATRKRSELWQIYDNRKYKTSNTVFETKLETIEG